MQTTATELISVPAAEVAVSIDGALVDVAYVRVGSRRRPIWPMLLAGALCAALSAVAFARGVALARDNRAALQLWTELERRPAHAFRPQRLSLAYDWLAFGGLACAVAAFGAAAWRRREPGQDASAYCAPDGETLAMCDGQQLWAVDDDGGRVALVAGAVAVARRGPVVYRVRAVAAPARHGVGVLAQVEGRTLAYYGGSALAHASVLALLWSLPPSPRTLGGDGLTGATERMVPASIAAMERSLPPPADVPTGEAADGNAGGAEAMPEGLMGTTESANATGRVAIQRRADEPQLARAEVIARARDTGILRVYGTASARDPFARITGDSWQSSGLSDRDIHGGMIGDDYRDMYSNTPGSGVRSIGPGGGGDSWNTIGTGDYRTIGFDPRGKNPDTRMGTPLLPERRRDPRGPVVDFAPSVGIIGDYDKALIRRYIKKQRDRLRHCYERQLMVDGELAGTVVARFAINDQGAVVAASASGLAGVDGCVAGVIKQIQFPKPQANDLFKVTYPLHFRPAGQ